MLGKRELPCVWQFGIVPSIKEINILSGFLERFISEDVKADDLLFARHKSFIISHFIGGVCALFLLPFYLLNASSPSLLGFFVIGWLCAPALISIYVTKTGELTKGYFLSSMSLCGLVSFLALLTGGIGSFLLPWLIVVPVEAALSGVRRVVLSAIALTCVSLVGLALLTLYNVLPQSLVIGQNAAFLLSVGLVSAVSYIGGLAMSIQKMHARSENELALRARRYRLLAENATDMITRHDKNGQVRFASGAVKEILGAQPDDILGDGLFDRVHVADRPAFLRAFVQAMELSMLASTQFRLKDDMGQFTWVEMNCRPMKGAEEGSEQNIVAITRDISAHKTLTHNLQEAKQDAERASEAKSQFLANMSHELRTPLNAIIGFSEVLQGTPGVDIASEQQEEYAGIIHGSGTHLLSVVNDLLEMAKIEGGSMTVHREDMSLSEEVLEVVALMSGEAEKAGIRVKAPVIKQNVQLVADKRAIKQILINLLSNAIKFSNQGGQIVIEAKDDDANLTISVRDQGIGIAKDVLPQLGKPFVQAQTDYNRTHEGSGLGLSIVKGLTELHGGSMYIESILGEGTKVSISLPKAVAETGPKDTVEPVKISA